MSTEFELRERGAHPTGERHEQMRRALRKGYELPRDTFITDDIPILLTKLSRIPDLRADKQ
ncbi:hypothetical protein FHR23_002999 [Stakelama sediminis]|uniref:Uncharacterized protein n=1 Tax=Stakelama sediminis TaxID=463200 RepID=A0A840Z2L1_9SPHN|nr:hypothetical protein [Stakelama sediminis]MBB5720039.1 hypothetical protein [Stakelama sediminis]